MKQHLTQLGLAICTAMCGLSAISGNARAAAGAGAAPAPEFAASHDTGSAAVKVQMVDDDVLAGQTGKYAGGTMISGFVLNIISQWQLPNGVTALAQGTLSAARNAAGQVSSSVSTLASVSDGGPGSHAGAAGSGADPNAQVNGGQSISVNGVSQVTQVAGDRNSGINSALIDFNNNASFLAGAANAPSAAASNSTGSVKAGISFGSNGIRVALQTPAGLATQTIAPGNGQIAQLLQIAGNNQQVANALQLHLQTQQMSAAMIRQSGVLQALQNRR
ncbi:peptidase C39 [Paraburkholderia xenovorans]|uniref:peptidase C39 n=1 Tax=Paraburkholderia xenovorans TaxID=36873 RepID=UPI0015C548B2|nr:peptidase C39 [Paraburkholderia xenovorans]NPT38171.1 peptidase C39 [Paraburkholderia xenovorans]